MSVHTVQLGDVVEIKGGGTPSKANAEFWSGDIPWVSPKDMKSWDICDAVDKITSDAIKKSATNLVPENAILVVNRSGILKHTLPVGIARRPVAINQDLKALISGPRANPDYVAHIVKAAEPIVLKWVRATTADNFPIDNLRSLEIPLPPLPEQRRIAAILDKADALRRKSAKAERCVGELSDALFISMFGTCKLDSTMWPMLTVSNVGIVQLGRQRAPKYQTGKFTRPYVRVANVYEDRIDTTDLLRMDFNDADFRDYRLSHGDILLNEGQSTELVGRPAMWRSEIEDCCFQNTLVRFQADRSRVMPEFALALFIRYFRAGEFSKISSKTSNVAHLGAGRFGMMPFPLPPIELQREFSDRLALIRRLKARHRAFVSKAGALFSSLQHRAFSGQL